MGPPPLPHQIDVLRSVLERSAADAGVDGARPAVVFDLDGTLFDNRHRSLQILAEYSDFIRPDLPEVADALATLSVAHIHHLLRETLRECGLTHADVIRDITHFWQQRFFSDNYLAYDVPREGAQEYAMAVHEAGARVIYISERDTAGMLVGTVASLRDHGFPFAMAGVELVLKPDATLGDESYKRAVLPTLARGGEIVGYFDDDPAGCNLARGLFDGAEIAMIDAQPIPGAPEPESGVLRVSDFRLT